MSPTGESTAWQHKDLISIADLSAEEMYSIFEMTGAFRDVNARQIKKVPTLRGKTVVNFFVETSTRTRTSFELAGKRMSADVINVSASSSAMSKGESLLDTARTLQQYNPDVVVLRHHASGAPAIMARAMAASIINAGDGAHQHPTQALLDAYTLYRACGRLSGLVVAIVGDVLHSRVARSDVLALRALGCRVILCGPPTLLPPYAAVLGAEISYDLDEVIAECDVIMALRMQLERGTQGFVPSLREYSKRYGLNPRRMAMAKPDVWIMHPGPTNRGVEIDPAVADGPRSLILDQVENGLALRMALLYLYAGGQHGEAAH